MRIALFGFLFSMLSFFSSNSFALTQKIIVGHHDISTIEIKKEKIKQNTAWTLKLYRNGKLVGGRALTEKTYGRIQKDFQSAFPDKKDSETCYDGILLEKSYTEKDIKRQKFCPSTLSKSRNKKISKLTRRLTDLAMGKSPIY